MDAAWLGSVRMQILHNLSQRQVKKTDDLSIDHELSDLPVRGAENSDVTMLSGYIATVRVILTSLIGRGVTTYSPLLLRVTIHLCCTAHKKHIFSAEPIRRDSHTWNHLLPLFFFFFLMHDIP